MASRFAGQAAGAAAVVNFMTPQVAAQIANAADMVSQLTVMIDEKERENLNLAELLASYAKCDACDKMFTSRNRAYILSCSHSICGDSLKEVSANGKLIEGICPLCNVRRTGLHAPHLQLNADVLHKVSTKLGDVNPGDSGYIPEFSPYKDTQEGIVVKMDMWRQDLKKVTGNFKFGKSRSKRSKRSLRKSRK